MACADRSEVGRIGPLVRDVTTRSPRSAAGPAAGASVTIADTPVTATADAQGRSEVTLPHGTCDLNATHSSRCPTGGTNGDIPSTATPNPALYPFGDDLVAGRPAAARASPPPSPPPRRTAVT